MIKRVKAAGLSLPQAFMLLTQDSRSKKDVASNLVLQFYHLHCREVTALGIVCVMRILVYRDQKGSFCGTTEQ